MTNTLIAVVWVVSIVTVLLVFVVSYVTSYVRAYHGPQTFSTWELVKMALGELVGQRD